MADDTLSDKPDPSEPAASTPTILEPVPAPATGPAAEPPLRPLPDLKDWRYEIDFEGLAWAILDRPGQSTNTLSRSTIEELSRLVDDLGEKVKAKAIRGVVFISGKEKSFIAGADIKEFDDLTSEAEVRAAVTAANVVLNRIESLPVPVVAAINGYCLGGGMELALACHYRIASREEGTRLGLPEIKLGIFPGFNNTMRSIRQAGPMAAMQLMLTGNMVRASAARAMGLVDELVASRHSLRWAARKAALQGRKSKGPSFTTRMMRQSPMRGLVAGQMRKKTREKVREDHYPAPFRLIDLFEKYGGDDKRMAAEETQAFAPLMVSETAKNLRRVFRLSEDMKNQAPKSGFRPARAHVIGAGTMGADIAAVFVLSGLEVSLQDLSAEQLTRAQGQAKALFQKRLKSKVEVEAAMARLILDQGGDKAGRADVVIVAIIERLDAKQALFRDLERRLKPGAVMATNTSSLPIEQIAEGLVDPGRLIGLHFFNPVPALPLVEVVRAPITRDDEVKKGCAVVTAIGKYPLIVKSVPGFLVNWVLVPYMMGAVRRFDEGTQREKIDEAAKAFGMPVGPLELADQVGLDICRNVAEVLKVMPRDAEASRLMKLVGDKKLGKKTGEGFYVWKDGKPVRSMPPEPFNDDVLKSLGAELIRPLVDECQKCLDEGVVASADMVDAGVIFGTGFAPFRGGPLEYAKSEKRVR